MIYRTKEPITISILIPCHNEEKSIRATIESCLMQSRKPDEILVVDDGSIDQTANILASFGKKVKIVSIPVATGNKSYAQEYGLKFITSDIFIATDGDTVLDKNFVQYIEEDFQNKDIAAVAGYVRSRPYNWLTACRAFEYAVGQNLHKLAQNHINFLFVIPGAAGAFRTNDFTQHIAFDHDTLTEDLDFTYRLHRKGLNVFYDRRVVVFTQDPITLQAYINQMRRWFGGGWQCLIKHYDLVFRKPKIAFEVSLMYLEGVTFSLLLFLIPLLSFRFFFWFVISYFIVAAVFALFAAWKEKRWELLLVPIPYLLLIFIHAYIFLEQMVAEVFFRRKNLKWFKPERMNV